MSDAENIMTVGEMMKIINNKLDLIEELVNIIGNGYVKSWAKGVSDEVQHTRKIMEIYKDYFISTGQIEEPISTEQTDDFDGHPNTVI